MERLYSQRSFEINQRRKCSGKPGSRGGREAQREVSPTEPTTEPCIKHAFHKRINEQVNRWELQHPSAFNKVVSMTHLFIWLLGVLKPEDLRE